MKNIQSCYWQLLWAWPPAVKKINSCFHGTPKFYFDMGAVGVQDSLLLTFAKFPGKVDGYRMGPC